ncbi:hypothetical protein [Leptolyngbya sp. 7M]|uniref:hypothetical protein n=1 Tax=Leptolyngbya sp. 7M TaxID=2812896 RepID=UPI001B8B10B0|nr:hypothetical protein [Leptolyngbya sp. 7M]QYO67997.1 hypothetical protein JVX88_15215 [Leptolyngbya sp. 7M]
MYGRSIVRIFVVGLLLCTICMNGSGQDNKEIWVTKVQAQTHNRLLITLWVENWEIRVDQDLPIRISIRNNGSEAVYFVRKEDSQIINDRGDVLIASPVPIPEDKGKKYDFSFHKIRPGEEHSGQFVIPHKLFQEEYDLNIKTGLGFVNDITGLDRNLKYGDDPDELRGILFRRIEVVAVGELRVFVRQD